MDLDVTLSAFVNDFPAVGTVFVIKEQQFVLLWNAGFRRSEERKEAHD